MENVLITGGAGFIGSHVGDLLIKNGYNVIVVDNLSSGKSHNLNKEVKKFYNLDINSTDIEKVFKNNKIDYVFHFAAQASVSFSNKYPTEDAIENVLGSVNILKLAKKYQVKKFMVSSTAAVYGVPEYLPVDEVHKTTCLSFYGVSKLTMEQYVKLFGIDYIIFRFANVYGPRQSAHGEAGVVAIFADKMNKNQPITIDGDGEQTRDFVYVTDIAEVCLCAVKSDVKNEIINVSTNTAISINKLHEIMATKFEYKNQPSHAKDRIGDIKHSILDNKKCKTLFNTVPHTSLDTGLAYLVDSIKQSEFFFRSTRQVEITTIIGCKNNCEYCPQSVLLENYYKDDSARKSVMSLNDFKSAIENIPKDLLINFGGMSEPFENNHAVDMMLYARERFRSVSVSTTLQGLSIDDMKRLEGVEFESWTIHTPDADGIMNQELTIDYLEKLKFLEKLNIKKIKYVVMGKPNELIQNVLGDKLKSEKIVLRGRNIDKTMLPNGLKFKRQIVPHLDSKVKVLCRKSLRFPYIGNQKIENSTLLPDGSLVLCANDYGLKHVLGNLYETDYKTIMSGVIMKNIKESMMCKNDEYLLCRDCEFALDASDKSWKANMIKKTLKLAR